MIVWLLFVFGTTRMVSLDGVSLIRVLLVELEKYKSPSVLYASDCLYASIKAMKRGPLIK